MITIVSGLPRSGTSMMMQALQAGGLPLLYDNERPPDEHNPRGYLEYQKVRRLGADNSWLAEGDGKAVKVVSQLLYHLAPRHQYRVLFMQRDLDEVISSQERMLAARHMENGPPPAIMREHFTRHLQALDAWLKQQPNIKVLKCNHHDMVTNPSAILPSIAAFLEVPLDIPSMAAAVDPTLHRQRAESR